MYELFCKITVFTNQTAKDLIPRPQVGLWMAFRCGCRHAPLCLGGNPQGSRSFWPLLQYDHWYHVASTRSSRLWGASLTLYSSSGSGGPTACDCSDPVSVLQCGGSLLVFFVSPQVGFLPEHLNVSLAPYPSQVSVLSDSCPCHVRSSGFWVLCSTASELLVSPPCDSQRCLASFHPRQR